MDDTKLLSQIEAAAIACRNTIDRGFLETWRIVDEFRALATPENVLRLVGMVKDGLGLRWTNEPPTVPGRYLFYDKNVKDYITIVSVRFFNDYDEKDEYLAYTFGWSEVPIPVEYNAELFWAGPIPMPQDAE